ALYHWIQGSNALISVIPLISGLNLIRMARVTNKNNATKNRTLLVFTDIDVLMRSRKFFSDVEIFTIILHIKIYN
ncbi:MAG: hypothetical protein KAT57_13205, partial [Candidatus Lokiarchaeota archaeon]|nr:hypothetical protein [Candidatus Lokiarchaeota archaeon]